MPRNKITKTLIHRNTTAPFKALPLAEQKATLMEIIEEIKVYRDRAVDLHFRENPLTIMR
jgi:hypothetical protein